MVKSRKNHLHEKTNRMCIPFDVIMDVFAI